MLTASGREGGVLLLMGADVRDPVCACKPEELRLVE